MSRTVALFFMLLTFMPLKALVYDKSLRVGPHLFNVNVPQNDAEQQKGLMFQKSLDDDRGMLFSFPQNRIVAMWMKNTLIPLDMLFLDKKMNIVYIAQNTKPLSTDIIRFEANPSLPRHVLELKGGICKKLGIKVGDGVIYPLNPKAIK